MSRIDVISNFLISSDEVPPSRNTLDETTILDYVFWRACGKTRQEAAESCKIDLQTASVIESTDDFLDQIDEVKKKIRDNPTDAILELMPLAIGVLRTKLLAGDTIAARELIRAAQIMSKEKADEVDRDADRRATQTVPGRKTITDAAKKLRTDSRKIHVR